METLKISVNIKDLEQLTKDYPEASNRARYGRVLEACLMLQNRLESPLSGHTPTGAGPTHYIDTIFSKVEIGQKLEYGVSVRGIVSSPLSYGAPLEYGRRPGKFPPPDPIRHWVEKKLGYSGKEAKSVAFLIARSISKHGTKGAHMYERTFNENKEMVISILNKIPEDIVNMLRK